jgi:hypothetical protein
MRFTQSIARFAAASIVAFTTINAFQPAFLARSHRGAPSTSQPHARTTIVGCPSFMHSSQQDPAEAPLQLKYWNQCWGVLPTLSAVVGWALASQVAWAAATVTTAPNMVAPESIVAAPGERETSHWHKVDQE